MSIFIPIGDGAGIIVDVLVVLSSDTTLEGELTVVGHLRGALVGSTVLTGQLSGSFGGSAALVGATILSGVARLNAEANVFGSVSFIGDTTLNGHDSSTLNSNIDFLGGTGLVGVATVTSEIDPSFVIAVDILNAAIVNQGNIRRYKPRFKVNGTEVEIRKAMLEASPDTLGTELKVTLLVPNAALVTSSSTIDFDLGLWTGSAFSYVSMMAGGKLSARSNVMHNVRGAAFDEVTLSIIDVVADRWNRAPRQPIHLYDPDKVATPTSSELDAGRIELFGGGYILPASYSFPGLSLLTILNFAYINGCGFSSIVCNIPNFPVSQADFSLDGGYDAGVRGLLQLFTPVVFERNNVLYIIDPTVTLPAGMSAVDFTHAKVVEQTDSLPQHEPVNALLVRYKDPLIGGEFYTERLDFEHSESGPFGDPGHTETDTSHRTREWRTFAAPLVVVREETVDETTIVHDANFNIVERTTTTEHFDTFNRKVGSTRRSDLWLPDVNSKYIEPDGDGNPQNRVPFNLITDALVQEQTITYVTNPQDPLSDLQDRVTTREYGYVLETGETFNFDNGGSDRTVFACSLVEAFRSGLIDPDNDDQHAFFNTPIKTTTEQLRQHGQQADMEVRVVNHLMANVATRSTVTTRPAVVSISRKLQSQQGRTILLTVVGTDAVSKRARVVDMGEIPGYIAVPLGQRILAKLNNPPRLVGLTAAYVDVTIKRGSILALKKRDSSALGNYMVTGWTIEFVEYDHTRGTQAIMTVSAKELTT